MTNSTMLTAARQPLAAIHLLIIIHCCCSFGRIEEHKSGFTRQLLEVLSFLPLLRPRRRPGGPVSRCQFPSVLFPLQDETVQSRGSVTLSQATRGNALQDAEPAGGPALGPPLKCSMTCFVLYNLMYITAGAGSISPFCQTETEISRDSISHLQ